MDLDLQTKRTHVTFVKLHVQPVNFLYNKYIEDSVVFQ